MKKLFKNRHSEAEGRRISRGSFASLRMTRWSLVILGLAFLLRVAWLGSVPIGLYSDEAAFGYNAYLLLNTGRDEYGRFWPVSLESFGDWKPPMSAWLVIPTIAIFGLNEFAVRLPSAILGTATVIVVYFLAKELFIENRRKNFSEHSEDSENQIIRLQKSRQSDSPTVRLSGVRQSGTPSFPSIPIIAALLLAINPWHIFMSRVAMLVAVEVFFVSLGVLGLVRSMESGVRSRASKYLNWWLALASVSFAGAIYSYYGSRVTVPLILIIFSLVYFNEVKKRWREIIFPVIFGAALLSPLVIQLIGDPLILTGRARTTSVFFNDNVRLQLWDAHTKAGLKNIPPVVSRFFDNKFYYYARDIIVRYVSHFSPAFLFFRGDSHPPFKIPGLGYLHLIDLPFFIVGLIFLRRSSPYTSSRATVGSVAIPGIATSSRRNVGTPRNDGQLFLILYLLAAPAVAALTFLTPAANRSFNMVIPWTLITAYGLGSVLKYIHESPRRMSGRLLIGLLAVSYSASMVIFAYKYIKTIPQELPHYWHYGRRELVDKLRPFIDEKRHIYLTNKGGPPYIFLSFYLPISPEDFHRTVKRNPVINDLGWGHVDGILGITIPREFSWNEVPKIREAMYVGFEDEIPEAEVDILDRVYYPNGRPVYTLSVIVRERSDRGNPDGILRYAQDDGVH